MFLWIESDATHRITHYTVMAGHTEQSCKSISFADINLHFTKKTMSSEASTCVTSGTDTQLLAYLLKDN